MRPTILLIFLGIGVACTSQTQTEAQTNPSKKKPETTKSYKDTPIQSTYPEKKTKDSTMTPIKTTPLSNLTAHLAELRQALQKDDSVKIICYGNSITNGYKVGNYGRVANPYPETLEKLLSAYYKNTKLNIHNEGHNGWRTDQALANLQKMVISQKPDWVIFKLGINDIYSGFSAQTYEKYLTQIVNALQQNGIKVLLMSPTPIHTEFSEKVIQFGQIVRQVAVKQNTAFFHLHQAIAERANCENVSFTTLLPDDVHFADDKYVWIAEELLHFLIEEKRP
jgi:lysophospholipase L1-like esterase